MCIQVFICNDTVKNILEVVRKQKTPGNLFYLLKIIFFLFLFSGCTSIESLIKEGKYNKALQYCEENEGEEQKEYYKKLADHCFDKIKNFEIETNTFGGKDRDFAHSIIQTEDGGYVVAGYTRSYGEGSNDAWVIKLNKRGKKQWDKTFGGDWWDYAYSIIQTEDGGYAIAGYTNSYGEGYYDAWVIKLNKKGKKQWDKTFGGKNSSKAKSIVQTKDGGYAFAVGYPADVKVIKLDKEGTMQWDKTFDGGYEDYAEAIIQTEDSGYAVAGYTFTGYTNSLEEDNYDAWVIKLDREGSKQWDKTFDGEYRDYAKSIIQTEDGGYVVAGHTYFCETNTGYVWIIKLDKEGSKQWDKTFGGKDRDYAGAIIQTEDGGYAVAGFTEGRNQTKDYLIEGFPEFAESFKSYAYAWVIKLDKEGNKQWDKTFGGEYEDYAESIIQTEDGGYVVAGYTDSYGTGMEDVFVINIGGIKRYIKIVEECYLKTYEAEALNKLANDYLKINMHYIAGEYYEKAGNKEGLKKVADAFYDNRDYDKAGEYYEKAGNKEGLKRVANHYYYTERRYREAAEIYKEIGENQALQNCIIEWCADSIFLWIDLYVIDEYRLGMNLDEYVSIVHRKAKQQEEEFDIQIDLNQVLTKASDKAKDKTYVVGCEDLDSVVLKEYRRYKRIAELILLIKDNISLMGIKN